MVKTIPDSTRSDRRAVIFATNQSAQARHFVCRGAAVFGAT
jgi:hypothetical protein